MPVCVLNKKIYSLLVALLLLVACESNTPSYDFPVVETTEAVNITAYSVVCGGAISSSGAKISTKGVCWSVNQNPTIDDTKIQVDNDAVTFSAEIKGLQPATTYHVRAFASNAVGVSYGQEMMFTTSSVPDTDMDNDNMMLGNPTQASESVVCVDNYLMVKDQYALSYNNAKRTMNWTCWHLYSGDIGSTDRQDDFRRDYELPSSWYRVGNRDYEYSTFGFDRGHMCPSADRTKTVADNSATFLMTNMIPQAPNNNQRTWGDLEDACRELVNSGNELYIISGPYGEGGTSAKGFFTKLNSQVVVPSHTWKIVVVLPNGSGDMGRISTTTRVIAVWMPNTQTVSSQPWRYYRTSVDYIESQTGYDFLSNVPVEVQNVIEASVDSL